VHRLLWRIIACTRANASPLRSGRICEWLGRLRLARDLGRSAFVEADAPLGGSYAGFLDGFLDWYGREAGQTLTSHQLVAEGTAADWTTNHGTFGDPKRTVPVDGYGEEPLNLWGDHYWMIDVDMDCSRAVDGVWFELKC